MGLDPGVARACWRLFITWTIPQLWTLVQSQGEHSFCGGPQQSHCVSYHHVAGTSVSACLCTRQIGLVCVMQLKEVREACWAMPALPSERSSYRARREHTCIAPLFLTCLTMLHPPRPLASRLTITRIASHRLPRQEIRGPKPPQCRSSTAPRTRQPPSSTRPHDHTTRPHTGASAAPPTSRTPGARATHCCTHSGQPFGTSPKQYSEGCAPVPCNIGYRSARSQGALQSSPTPICWESDVKIGSRFKCPNTSADSDSDERAMQICCGNRIQ